MRRSKHAFSILPDACVQDFMDTTLPLLKKLMLTASGEALTQLVRAFDVLAERMSAQALVDQGIPLLCRAADSGEPYAALQATSHPPPPPHPHTHSHTHTAEAIPSKPSVDVLAERISPHGSRGEQHPSPVSRC